MLAGSGGVAQLGERLNGIQEVRGSIPLASIAVVLNRTFRRSLRGVDQGGSGRRYLVRLGTTTTASAPSRE